MAATAKDPRRENRQGSQRHQRSPAWQTCARSPRSAARSTFRQTPARYGPYKAKLSFAFIDSLKARRDGKLILVTAITPTPAGEGKTTTTVGLGDGLNRIGQKAIICIREPSLGPCFGMKGGAAGGGYAQVVPMEDINLHFTGDFHAITTAHNLLSR